MLQEINEKLEMLKDNIELQEKLQKEVSILENSLENKEIDLKILEEKLEKKKKSIDDLNKFSVINKIVAIFKNKEEVREKEEQEYLENKLKYDEIVLNIDILRNDLKSKEDKLNTLASCINDYNKVLEEKLIYIKKYCNKEINKKIQMLDEKIIDISNENKGIEEAYLVGGKLLDEVKSAEEELKSAKNWGKFDIIGGDAISSIAKHNRIRKVNYKFETIQKLLNDFNKELGDIKLNNISFSNITFVMDVFFDNIFTDISVQRKINESLNSIENLKSNIEHILSDLRRRNNELVKEIDEVRKRYLLFIEEINE